MLDSNTLAKREILNNIEAELESMKLTGLAKANQKQKMLREAGLGLNIVRSVDHTIRTAKGFERKEKLSARNAIRFHCRECLGFEGNPKDCNSKHCALWPWRSTATPKGNDD